MSNNSFSIPLHYEKLLVADNAKIQTKLKQMMISKFKCIVIILACLTCTSSHLQAQNTKGWGIVGSTYFNSPYGRYIFDIGAVKTWGFGKYITLGVGGKYSYIQTDDINTSWMSGNQRYGIDSDKPLMGLQGLGTVDFTLPIVKGFGIYANANVSFDILPWDYIEVKKYSMTDPLDYETKTIYAFNGFAPKVFAGGGVYYDFKSDKSTARVALGYSYGYYDALSGSRKKTYDGQNLGDYLPKGDYLRNLSLKVIFYY